MLRTDPGTLCMLGEHSVLCYTRALTLESENINTCAVVSPTPFPLAHESVLYITFPLLSPLRRELREGWKHNKMCPRVLLPSPTSARAVGCHTLGLTGKRAHT